MKRNWLRWSGQGQVWIRQAYSQRTSNRLHFHLGFIKLHCALRRIKLPNNHALIMTLQTSNRMSRNISKTVFFCDDSDDDFWGKIIPCDRCTLILHVGARHLQFWGQSRLCVLPFLGTSLRAGTATWRVCQRVVISIPPSILIQCAVALKNR